MEQLVQSLGVTSALFKSQVSVMARDLDEQGQAIRSHPLDQGPYRYSVGVGPTRCTSSWSIARPSKVKARRSGSTRAGRANISRAGT